MKTRHRLALGILGTLVGLLALTQGCGKSDPAKPQADGPQLGAAAPDAGAGSPATAQAPRAAGLKADPGKPAPAPPMQLTSSDGQGLTLTKLQARAVLDGPLALTELHLTFHNDEARQRQGTFEIVLPPGAQVSRFAMKNPSGWMEGEVVEKQQARRVYEDFLHRKQDPALLEQDQGNRFSARVFPIPPSADKELIVSYSQTLVDARAPYLLPLRGLPRLGTLTIRAFVHGTGATQPAPGGSLGATVGAVQTVQVDKTDWQPDADFEVSGQTAAVQEATLRHDNLALARIVLPGTQEAAKLERVVLLVDTSASQVLAWEQLLARTQQVLELIAKDGGDVAVVAFDQTASEVVSGSAKAIGESVAGVLRKRGALGASDLQAGLAAAAKAAERWKQPARLILLGDGMATAGEVDPSALAKQVSAMSTAFSRLDAVPVTPARNQPLLQALTTAGLSTSGLVLDGSQGPDAIGDLRTATLGQLQVSVPGAEWVWPQTLAGKRAGEAVLVYADLPKDKPMQVVLSGAAPYQVTPPERAAAKPLLERAWVGARIERLLIASGSDPDLQAAMRAQAIALSVKHRVLCPETALLVLESESDYTRYNIPRTALAEILTVSPEGVAVLEPRKDPFVALQPAAPRAAKSAGGAPVGSATRLFADEDNDPGEGGQAVPSAAGSQRDQPSAAAAPSAEPEAEEKMAAREEAAPPPPMRQAAPALAEAQEEASERAIGNGSRGMGFRGTGSGGGGDGPGPRGLGIAAPSGRGSAIARDEEDRDSQRERRPFRPDRMPRPEPRPDPDDTGDLGEIRKAIRDQSALTGPFADITNLLRKGNKQPALQAAMDWRTKAPTDVLALVALGHALKANGYDKDAARAYGSIIDLFPMRADLRRFAGNLLETLGKDFRAVAIDTYQKAQKDRPDHPSVHIMLATALLQDGKALEALDVLEAGLQAQRRSGNFSGSERIMMELMGIAAASHLASVPEADRAAAATKLQARLSKYNVTAATEPSVRFVLTWETDANDVDFHIVDKKDGHASYRQMHLDSGGELFADITTGYGPECFAVNKPKAFPYQLFAHYYAMGPMGYGMGRVQVLRHDGKGKLTVDERPFVIMKDQAWVDLGVIKG
jgi:tetratricopeptide (TPR) repeat protein